MKIAVFAGSMCPITLGHLNVIMRASRLVDKLYVVTLANSEKKNAISQVDRIELIKSATKDIPNVVVDGYKGALVDYCKSVGADAIIKSVRNAVDMQFEIDMAKINRDLTGIETLYLACDSEYANVSSTYVRELVGLGKDISSYVPQGLAQRITTLLKAK